MTSPFAQSAAMSHIKNVRDDKTFKHMTNVIRIELPTRGTSPRTRECVAAYGRGPQKLETSVLLQTGNLLVLDFAVS